MYTYTLDTYVANTRLLYTEEAWTVLTPNYQIHSCVDFLSTSGIVYMMKYTYVLYCNQQLKQKSNVRSVV